MGTPVDIDDICIIFGQVARNACGYILTVHNRCFQKRLALPDLLHTAAESETIKKLENIVKYPCEFIKIILVKHQKYSTGSYQENLVVNKPLQKRFCSE